MPLGCVEMCGNLKKSAAGELVVSEDVYTLEQDRLVNTCRFLKLPRDRHQTLFFVLFLSLLIKIL